MVLPHLQVNTLLCSSHEPVLHSQHVKNVPTEHLPHSSVSHASQKCIFVLQSTQKKVVAHIAPRPLGVFLVRLAEPQGAAHALRHGAKLPKAQGPSHHQARRGAQGALAHKLLLPARLCALGARRGLARRHAAADGCGRLAAAARHGRAASHGRENALAEHKARAQAVRGFRGAGWRAT